MFSLFKKPSSSTATAHSEAVRELNAFKSEREALARSQALLELASDGTILSASGRFAALLGYDAPELAGVSLPALAAPAGSDAGLWAAVRRGEDYRGELAYAAKGGETRWLQIAATPLTGGADGVGRIVAFASDVSALRAELETISEELKVRQDIMNVTSIVSEGDKTGLILSCNDKYVEISKYGREELLGQGHNITRHPDMPKAVFKEMWNTIGHGRIFRGVVKNRAKDGTPYYVDAVIAPILGANGKPKKYLGVRYDITASELERQNARGILAAVDESFAYVEFDLGGNVTAANDNFLALMGYRREEVLGRHHRRFVEREHAGSQAYTQFWAELNAGNAQSELFKRITKDGTEVYIQGTYAPVKDEMGRVFKIVKIATDVTAQQRYQAEVAAVLQETSAVMREVESGNLTPQMSGSYSEEFTPLKEAVNGSIVQLREIVGRIRSGALSINTAAGEVSKGNTELSARTEEQASSLEQTAASMEEMTSTVERNAENSRQADQFASSVREQAVQGGQVVSRAIEAMAGINQSSRKIAEIIGVIDEIAFQTNLLALNAAVEAARAGDQGRGFAVVASEVRNLAQRSAAAAKEIKTLIHDSVQKVADGSKLVDESGAVLTTIVESVTKVSQIVADIAVASGEQSSGIGQVGQAVAQMDQMTQQNAALVEEAAAASESMDEESRTLITLMQFFNTGDGPAPVAAAVERRGADRPWSGRAKPAAAPAAKPKAKPRPAARAAAPKAAESDDWAEF